MRTESIPMKSHVPVVSKGAKAATCTENGYTEEKICSVCKTVLTESTPLTAPGHNYVFFERINADCSHGGCDVYVCKNCGSKENRSETPVLSHDFILALTKEPTCTEKGFDIYVCRYCAQKQQRNETAMLNHNFVLFGTIDPTCTEGGYQLYECAYCGKLEKCGEVPAWGHYETNKDGKCDSCSVKMDKDDPSEDCDCVCHRTGIFSVFYRILHIIWKVFALNPTCECGAAHY